jgi:hypothetical protein
MNSPSKTSDLEGMGSEQIRMLAAIGFMAARSGLIVPAVRIFEGLAVLRPNKAFPFVGLSLAHICVGSHAEAIQILIQRGLKVCPDDPELVAYLAVALQLAGRTAEAQQIYDGFSLSDDAEASEISLKNMVESVMRVVHSALPKPASVIELSKVSAQASKSS